MLQQYDKRSTGASPATMSVADSAFRGRHVPRMLGSADLLAALRRLKSEEKTTNADLARLLSLPSSRIAEIFEGKRAVKIDEMKTIVEHFELEEIPVGRNPPAPANDDDVVEIVALDLSLSMGPGTNID